MIAVRKNKARKRAGVRLLEGEVAILNKEIGEGLTEWLFEVKVLSEEVWQISGKGLADIWEKSGGYLEKVWQISGESGGYLGKVADIWGKSGRYLGKLSWISGESLADIWGKGVLVKGKRQSLKAELYSVCLGTIRKAGWMERSN